MAARPLTLTSEVVRDWCRRFGQPTLTSYAAGIPDLATYGTWIKCCRMITGACHYLWRAVDQDGHVLDILRRGRHDKAIATTFCRKCSRVWISSTKSEKFQPFFRKALIDLE